MSGEELPKISEKVEKATVVLIDVAGTSSSICFVKDTLFPYVLKTAEKYLTDKWEESELKEIISSLRDNDSEIAKEGEKDVVIKSLVESIKKLTEKQSDIEPFKKFQGLIYAAGYASGDLKGHVFADVATQLPIWANGKRVCVYSTGSVQSQKLLFTHSTEGDLSAHITEYFDQAVGAKTEAASYKNIVEKLQCKAEDVVFLTDIAAEAKAAMEAGLNSVLVSRDGNAEITEEEKKLFPVIKSFADLPLETSAKRKIAEESDKEAPPAKVAKTESEPEKIDTTAKVAEEASATNNDVEEKMEVDAVDTPEVKEPVVKETSNDTDAVSSTSESKPEAVKEIASSAEEPAAESKEAEPVCEKKPVEKEAEATEVPSATTTTTEEPKPAEEVKETTDKKKETENKTETVTSETNESKPESTESQQTEKSESKVVETKITETKETEKEPVENEKSTETADKVDSSIKETVEETKTEKVEVTKTKETDEKPEKTDKPKEATDEKEKTEVAKEEKVETKPEETKEDEKAEEKTSVVEEKEKVSESKEGESEKKDETKEKEGGESTNGDGEPVANGSGAPEEKENNSDLANGAAAHAENGEDKKKEEEAEIKVKKLEAADKADSENVSVEVKA